MTRIFWDAIFLISGSLFTIGTGPSSPATIEANITIHTNTSRSSSLPTADKNVSAENLLTATSSVVVSGAVQTDKMITNITIYVNVTTSRPPTAGTSTSKRPSTSSKNHSVKKFVAAAVRSHFDDCPDSHQNFCFHGTCRFLILEETPACVCHPGFIGMRCEHADLLAVVATNHRKQAMATVLVLCVIGCVLIMVLCSFLHCWWRQDCRRRSYALHYAAEKHGASCYPPESVV